MLIKIHCNVRINGKFLRTEVYILSTITLIVCYPKVVETCYITKSTNAVCKSKLHVSVLDPKINIDNYKILRCDRNKQQGGAACYVKNGLTHKTLSVFRLWTEKIFC